MTTKGCSRWVLLALSTTICFANNQFQLTNSASNAHEHSCITIYGQSTCWGRNSYGQLGLETTTDHYSPMNISINLPTDFEPIQTINGYQHSIALSVDGRVVCWGRNEYGQLGIGSTATVGNGSNEMGDDLQITDLGTNFTVIQVVSGQQHKCAMSEDQEIKCWGMNAFYQLGYG